MHKAIFYDRDGIITLTINNEAPQLLQDLQINKDIIPILHRSKSLGYLNIIISNQPDYALGKINNITRLSLEKKFRKLITQYHLPIDKIYYCHHHPKAIISKFAVSCTCRKPLDGMIQKAAQKYSIILSQSLLIGDRASDIKAGSLAKVQTILFDSNNSQVPYLEENNVRPKYKISQLNEILEILTLQSKSETNAIILASGIGSRMMPLTKNTPKPLLKINNKPMMEYVIDLLISHQIRNIGVNLFYLADQIKDYFSNGSKYGARISYIKEDTLSGTAGGIKSVAQILELKKPFFVISSDMMINFDLSSIYQFHLEKKGVATICCYFRSKKNLDPKKSGVILFDPKTYLISQFIERPGNKSKLLSQWVNSSVYVFDPKILNYIPNIKNITNPIDLAKDIFPKLIEKGEKIYAYPVNNKSYYQLGIDTPERIKKAEEDIKKGKFKPVYSPFN